MFVPIEPAFLLALQNDESLWHDAYSKGVLLSGPTTVLFVVRIVADLWRQEMQVQNVKEIVERGAKLYEKFVGFVDDLEKLGKGLRDATGYYDDARRKLTEGPGNLINQVETLRKLGVKPRKQLPKGLLDTSGDETQEVEQPTAERVTIFEAAGESSVDSAVEQGIAESDAV
jgi:DNA recombination protein RmuC